MLTYPLVDGNGADRGIWDPKNNDLAWEVLLPSLRLASMILAHLHTHPWVSAFREICCRWIAFYRSHLELSPCATTTVIWGCLGLSGVLNKERRLLFVYRRLLS